MAARVSSPGERLLLLASIGLGVACGSEEPPSVAPESELSLGVVPYFARIAESCPISPDLEPISFKMDDEDDTDCSHESGSRSEGSWVDREARKPDPPDGCNRRAAVATDFTTLRFCRARVPSTAFRPLTADPEAREHFYAVLLFGEQCPAHSVEVWKRIVNEDTQNDNLLLGSRESLGPNEITGDALGNYTRLVFCLFRAAPSVTETMPSFPDLGIPYAVFHDFEERQPAWVISKRFQYSDDSNNNNENSYGPASDPDEALTDFQKIVENPEQNTSRARAHDTTIELARVR